MAACHVVRAGERLRQRGRSGRSASRADGAMAHGERDRSGIPSEKLAWKHMHPEDARRLIGNVVAQDIVAVMQREEAYSEQRYIAALRGLPGSAV